MICEAKERYPEISVGWSLSQWIDTRLTLCALQMALAARRPESGSIHHSD
jgi:transposase InsO family protein